MEPEFEDQRPLVGQHLFEAQVALHRLLQVGHLAASVDAIDQGLAIPGALEDGHAPLGRQQAPEAPHRRAVALLVGGLAQAVRVDVAGVEPGIEQAHRLAPAAAVDPAYDHHHGKGPALDQVVLGVEQGLAQGGQLGFIGLFVDFVAQLGGFEHPQSPQMTPRAWRKTATTPTGTM